MRVIVPNNRQKVPDWFLLRTRVWGIRRVLDTSRKHAYPGTLIVYESFEYGVTVPVPAVCTSFIK
eukprot:2498585-Rhodomonas_salina.1